MACARPAILLTDSVRLTLILVAACSFALPITIAHAGDVEIPLAVVLALFGVPAILTLARVPGAGWLIASVAVAVVSVCAWDISPGSAHSVRPYLSFLFFYAPYLGYGAGYAIVRRPEDLTRFISVSALVASLSGIGIVATLYVLGLPVLLDFQDSRSLQGSLVGLPLYATYGVNSLAITEFVLFAFIWIDLLFVRKSSALVIALKLAGIAALGGLIFFSLSRGALLSCLLFLVLSLVVLALNRPRAAIGVGLAVVVVAAFVGSEYSDLINLSWRNRFNETTGSIARGDADVLTSGRLTLVNAALADLEDNPFLGVGFTGFHDGKSTFGDVEAQNSSPHNQYLTILWKPGLISGGLLLAFLWTCMSRLNQLRRCEATPGIFLGIWCLAVALLGVACLTWDVLLVTNIGAVTIFLFGACVSILERQKAGTVV